MGSQDARKIYVASPLGFFAAGRAYSVSLQSELADHGYRVLDPWTFPGENPILAALLVEEGEARSAQLRDANRSVGRRNAELIRECEGVLAILDGPDVDSGTASEIGFAAALGKPIVGLRTDWRDSGDNEGAVVNLQVEYFISLAGGSIVEPRPGERDHEQLVRMLRELDRCTC